MVTREMVSSFELLRSLVDMGEFERAMEGAKTLFQQLEYEPNKTDNDFLMLFNVAGVFVDIGSMEPNAEAASIGLALFENNEEALATLIDRSEFYYNLSNAKSNFIDRQEPAGPTFGSIEQLVELKKDLWKAVKYSQLEGKASTPELITNLGNVLKRQLRFVEALQCYDRVNSLGLDIPQAWINRSEALVGLNILSSSYSVQMLHQIRDGYKKVLASSEIPPAWIPYYEKLFVFHSEKVREVELELGVEVEEDDLHATGVEYEDLTEFRKFCLANHFSLSEHGLYCSCAGSARDNLTIPTQSGVVGEFIIPMEMVLNRLKSEFSLARKFFYEYSVDEAEKNELFHESCFSELFDDELLGLEVEKLRTAFKMCFGILDKIGIAICELFDVYLSKNSKVSFQSFWRLEKDERRQKFDDLNNPGLLALYSIATDLIDQKGGEWSFLKDWRNNLEHEFLVVHKADEPSELYDAYDFMPGIIFVKESEFVENLRMLLQITRSAIFSFVFCVRHEGMKRKQDTNYFPNEIHRRDSF